MAPKGMVFEPFCSEIGIDFHHFGLKIAYSMYTLIWNWVQFLEEATFLLIFFL